jgi:hypothetical protein
MSTTTFHPIAGGPCATLAEAAVHARRPFTSDVVQARIWTQTETDADVVFYVDVRAVVDRLNVLLPGRWRSAYELIDQRPAPVEGGDPLLVYECRLTLFDETYADVGEGPDHKAARSDALKRAAVHIGIGHCLYRIGRVRMRPGTRRHQLRGRPGWFELDDANRRWLRARYVAWLVRAGVAEYGLPLAHGRAARSVAAELFPADPRAVLAAGRRRRAGGSDAPGTPPALAVVPLPDDPAPTLAAPPADVAAPSPPSDTPAAPEAAASPEQRAALLEIARRHGYSPTTVAALVDCVHAATLDELGERALHGLRGYLDSAAGGNVSDAELAARIAELAAPAPGEPPARERLAAWLLKREEAAAAA